MRVNNNFLQTILNFMKMKKNNFSILMGAAVLALTVGLNVRHALNDYGVKTNKLHLEVLAQTSTTGGGSTINGVSGSASNFSFNNQEWDTDSHWYNLTNNWKPVLVACTASSGSSTFTVSTGGSAFGLSWDGYQYTYNGAATSYNGLQVLCQGGTGNCYDGTGCLGMSVL